MQLLAIDLGKRSFHIHGITDDGEVISKKVSRAKLEAAVLELAPESLAMEACASAYHEVTKRGRSYRDSMPRVCHGNGPRVFLCVL